MPPRAERVLGPMSRGRLSNGWSARRDAECSGDCNLRAGERGSRLDVPVRARGGEDVMTQTRRTFLKSAGAAGVAIVAGKATPSSAKTLAKTGVAAIKSGPRDLPKQMTFCTLRKGDELSLGIKTSRGI